MRREETRVLLRIRSSLTSQPYGEETIDVWAEALEDQSLDSARTALVEAARHNERVTIAHLFSYFEAERRRTISTERRYPWNGPTEAGRAIAGEIRAHLRREHAEEDSRLCPTCHPELRVEQITGQQALDL
jgi:hypothetical protein